VALRREKVQIIRWGDNPLRRIFGIYTLGIRQAAAGERASSKKAVQVPGCYLPQVEEVLYSCFPGTEAETYETHRIHKAFVWRRFIFLGLLPMLGCLGLFLIAYEIRWAVLMLALPAIALVLLLVFHKKYKLQVGTEYLRTTRGLFATSYSQLPFYKVQTVSIVQSIYQRRKALANVTIYTAGGAVTIPFLDLAKAQALQNYILYKVESSNKAWM
jgi:putative membrane protein